MIIDINKQYITKHNHYHVEIDQILDNLPVYTVFGHIFDHNNHAQQHAWRSDGSVWENKPNRMDLIEAPNFKQHTIYHSIYYSLLLIMTALSHHTKFNQLSIT
jgi:hypothetical protein